MKKNLQKILVLALGLTTTIASAQFSASSTSRINNTDSDARTGDHRIALSADYGAVHVSSDVFGALNAAEPIEQNNTQFINTCVLSIYQLYDDV